MATTTNLLTWEAFERIPDDGMHRELIEGELIVLPPPKSTHTLIVDNVTEALRPIKLRRMGRVLVEAGYWLATGRFCDSNRSGLRRRDYFNREFGCSVVVAPYG